jgi:hypothetical protein
MALGVEAQEIVSRRPHVAVPEAKAESQSAADVKPSNTVQTVVVISLHSYAGHYRFIF